MLQPIPWHWLSHPWGRSYRQKFEIHSEFVFQQLHPHILWQNPMIHRQKLMLSHWRRLSCHKTSPMMHSHRHRICNLPLEQKHVQDRKSNRLDLMQYWSLSEYYNLFLKYPCYNNPPCRYPWRSLRCTDALSECLLYLHLACWIHILMILSQHVRWWELCQHVPHIHHNHCLPELFHLPFWSSERHHAKSHRLWLFHQCLYLPHSGCSKESENLSPLK